MQTNRRDEAGSSQRRAADKTAFNKENPTELMGQLVKVLRQRGMRDALELLKRHHIPQVINDAWLASKGMSADDFALLQGRVAARYQKRTASSALGGWVYLTPEQSRQFGVGYRKKGDQLVVAASTLLRSADYDDNHQRLLKPLGNRTIVGVNNGLGWFEITEVF
jgi:hypothetical protein